MVLDAATIDSTLDAASANAVTNSAITNRIVPLENADIPSARPLGDGNYQLNVNGDTNMWTEITATTVGLDLDDLDDVTAPSPGMDNLLQWNGVTWQNAIVGNVWDDGFAATLNTNAVALGTATDPVFTDTTYNLNATRNSVTQNVEVNLRDGNTVDDIVDTITFSGGTNISLGFFNDTITINAPNFSDVEVYTTTALRNAATDVVCIMVT